MNLDTVNMGKKRAKQLDLKRFAAGTARLGPSYCQFVATACAVKLKEHGHANPAELTVSGLRDERVQISWDDPDPREPLSIGDKATEFAGECVGIALCEKFTNFNVVERSYIGTGFDFWLGRKKDFLFQKKAKLEMSGIDHGGNSDVNARVKEKAKQINAEPVTLADGAFIVVSEFGRPISKVVRHA